MARERNFSTPQNDSGSGDNATHILVIRLSAMGDVAMTVPVLRKVTANFPNLKITVLTRGLFAPIFKGIPNIEIYEADLSGVHNGVAGLCRLAKDLRDLDINAVADLHDVLRTNILKSIFYFYGIPVKQIDKGRAEKKALISENNKVFKQLKSTHQRYADVFAELGYPVELKDPVFPKEQKLTPRVLELTGKNNIKWLGVAPFAQHEPKVYPLDLMEQVIEEIAQESKTQIFLFGGGKSEIEKLEVLASKFNDVISIAGKLSFEEELILISNLDAMLSMDSGNAHLAAMYGIPVITLWGATHPYSGFAAFNQPPENNIFPDLNKYPKLPTSIYGNKIIKGYEEVMRTISPESVVELIKKALA